MLLLLLSLSLLIDIDIIIIILSQRVLKLHKNWSFPLTISSTNVTKPVFGYTGIFLISWFNIFR